MKIQILSDLHLEFGNFSLPSCDRDLLILAGDVHVGEESVPFLKEQLKISPVIYILGNHEFYKHDVSAIITFYQRLNLPGLYFLHNSVYQTTNVRFLGCPLWTDVNQGNKLDMQTVKNGLSDFQVIQNGFRHFTVHDSIERHVTSMTWLQAELGKPFDGKTVVITHHLPSLLSIDPKYAQSHLNYAFASNLDEFILETHPELWIHGHTHESVDYHLGKTKVICNPRGYAHEVNPSFRPCFTLEL